jgi:hypothetical protein
VLASYGYDSVLATPEELDERLRFGSVDLVILSVMLSEPEKHYIQVDLPIGTRPLALKTFVEPDELLRMVAEALT